MTSQAQVCVTSTYTQSSSMRRSLETASSGASALGAPKVKSRSATMSWRLHWSNSSELPGDTELPLQDYMCLVQTSKLSCDLMAMVVTCL